MNDELNNGLKYDKTKLTDMQRFLNHILTIAKSNPTMSITPKIVYNELKNWNIKSSDKNAYGRGSMVDYYFKEWIDSFQSVKNIDVFRTAHFHYWCQFENNPDFEECIKLYIPIDGEHLNIGVRQLFDFIAKNNISHSSKVGSELRSDNVIVRVKKGDTVALKKIIDFINNNRYLKEGLNPVNPFLPTINGIGAINETGISYNSEISKAISVYIEKHKNDNRIDINDFIASAKSSIYLEEVRDTFELATNTQEQYFDKKSTSRALTDIQKQSLLYDTVRATIDKYDINQAQVAIKNAIKNSYYGYFTNGNSGYRNMISKNITGSEMLSLIEKVVPSNGNVSLDSIIQNYCNFVYSNKILKYFDDMCKVTLENHGNEFLYKSLKQFYFTGSPDGFSRHSHNPEDKINYREYCKYFNNKNLPQILASSLLAKGIQADRKNLENIIYQYTNALDEANYEITR